MKKFIVFILLAISINVYAFDSAQDYLNATPEAQAAYWENIADRVNADAPFFVDPITVMKKITPLKNGTSTEFILINPQFNRYTKSQYEGLVRMIEMKIKESLCKHPNFEFARDTDSEFTYIFYNLRGDRIGYFTIRASITCGV